MDVPLSALKGNSAAHEDGTASTSCTWKMTDGAGGARAPNGNPFVWLHYPENGDGLIATELIVREDSLGLALYHTIGDPDAGDAFEFRKVK